MEIHYRYSTHYSGWSLKTDWLGVVEMRFPLVLLGEGVKKKFTLLGTSTLSGGVDPLQLKEIRLF